MHKQHNITISRALGASVIEPVVCSSTVKGRSRGYSLKSIFSRNTPSASTTVNPGET
ncbi:MAG: hypothetical protein ACJAYC_001091 [Halieaceae bacterium]|jgi:hypothetical protein